MIIDRARVHVAAVASLLAVAAVGCTGDNALTNVNEVSPDYSATRTAVKFTIGPLVITGLTTKFPDGRLHFRDIMLSGPVSGDLVGTARLTLNANLDSPGGSGPAWGKVTIVTSAGEWQGNLVGTFDGSAPGPGIQLFSRIVLQGPGGQKLRADCNETSATSETLVCRGEILNPHG
jgi:hypothetical protein